MFSHLGIGGPYWGVDASEYLIGMSMVPKSARDKEIEQFALELKKNPKLRNWCALLIQASIGQLESNTWEKAFAIKGEPSAGVVVEDTQALQRQYEKALADRNRLIQTIMGKSIHAFIPFWEERVAEELLRLTEEGVLTKTAIERAFESEPKFADFFHAAIARQLAQTTTELTR